ncbi:MAG: protein phosphatase [Deltaproteobacteria bacterium]|nr:protein phosphatase [Deltaproteobacteria bacterium]
MDDLRHLLRSSPGSPLPVDWLPALPGGLPGALGLTMLPGRRGRGAAGRVWERELALDLRQLRDDHRADRLVSLVEDHELDAYGVPGLVEAAAAAGLTHTRFPIPDGTVPREGPPALQPLVVELVGALRAGERVVVHCVAGLGRTGTVSGCVLVALGMEPPEALALLAEIRGPHCPETGAQRWFVGAYLDEVGLIQG